MGNFKSLRRFCGVLIVGLLLVGPAWSKIYLPEDAVKLDVQVKGNRVHFTISNVSPYDIQVFDDSKECPRPMGWPFFGFLQIRDSYGRVLTVNQEGRATIWAPSLNSGYVLILPVELDWLRAGEQWKTDTNLESCLRWYARTHLDNANRRRNLSNSKPAPMNQEEFFRSFDSVKIHFCAMLNPMLSESIRLETDWIKLDRGGWFAEGSFCAK